ncbi:MAG: TlpA family protein disulfide reductase [Oscillospiraceae bacterium]|nr:TlpA family protein disulfide reductase [Oscillospiraceae bacterium]
MTEDDMDSVSYVLGDAVLDFTVTMSDGETYTLSDLLSDHKAVVLNFWFMGCGPCRSEFPHLQQAYEAYSEEIAVLAMDPVDASDAEIEAFRQENGYTFPMGKCDSRWTEMMQITAFPLTVVIDRYGNISLMHLGAVPDTQMFMDMFAHYCADDYRQGFYSSIDQVPGVG